MGQVVSLIGQLIALGLFPFKGRPRLTANRTYFVRSDGNDSNSGLVNSAGGAFLTIQKAVDVIAMLDINGFTVTVQVVDGTYTGATVLKSVVGFSAPGCLVIQGNNATPANVLVSTAAGSCFTANGISSVWDIKDMKLASTVGSALAADNNASIRFNNLNFGVVAAYHCFANLGSTITGLGNYAVSGLAINHWYAVNGGKISVNGVTVTITGTPFFSGQWAQAVGPSTITAFGNTFSGSATGTRYSASNGGYIFTNGAVLPGSGAGSSTTGYYI